MANVKISELPVAASVDGASSFPVVEGGVTKQVTFTGMLASPSLFASGMATFFATPSSANLRAALTDETGTGAAVFADSPTLSGTVSVTGTVAATKLIPTGNVTAGNGMYLPATNQVAFSTDGSERVRIDASGNVGIGTNAPSEKLNVQGTAASSAFAVRFSNTSSTANSAAVLSLDPGNNGFNSRDAQIRATNNGSNQVSLSFYTADAATPAEAMRLDPSGNLIAKVNAAAPSLSTNRTMSFELTSNTSLKIVVRGSDGVTRSVSLTLA